MSAQDPPYPWHHAPWARIAARLDQGRMPHAVLLTGPQGVGKRALADHLARRLLCREPLNGGPCGACRGCQLMASGGHPDHRLVTPEEGKKTIGVDAVRELGRVLRLTSQYGGERVGVIALAEQLTTNAANSLLKTLEEPPAATTLILVSERPGRLLATVRSRCQQWPVPAPSRAEATEWLTSRGAPEAAALLGVTGNAPLAAEALHEAGGSGLLETLTGQLAALATGRLDPVAAAAHWKRDQVPLVVELLLAIALDLVRVQVGGAQPAIEALQRMPRPVDSEGVHGFVDALLEQQRLRDHPLNPELVLEGLFVQWRDICPREVDHG